MSDEPVRWSADDPESMATQIGGRPIQMLWPFLRSGFRTVFLEPHRRAGGGTVGWRWREPKHAPKPSASDLAVLRRRLGGALLDFADELERREAGSGGGNSRELHGAMETLVGELTRADDNRLAAYVVSTESGWMIRSWGFPQPAVATMDGASESKLEEENPEQTNVSAPEATPKSSRRRKRWLAGWTVAGAAAIALGGWWILSDSREPQSIASSPVSEVIPQQRVETHTKHQEAPPTERPGGGAVPKARPGPVMVVTGARTPDELVPAPIALAFSGVRAGGDGEIGDAAGPRSRLAGEPEPGITVIIAKEESGEMPPIKKSSDDEPATKSIKKTGGEPEAAVNAGDGGTSVAVDPGSSWSISDSARRTATAKENVSTVEARRVVSVELNPAPEPQGGKRTGKSSEAGDESENETSDSKSMGTPNKKPVRPSPGASVASDVLSPVSRVDSPLATVSDSLAETHHVTMTIGVSRVVRVRDVVLATWPASEEGRDTLRAARTKALAEAKAGLPPTLKNYRLRHGWQLRPAASGEAVHWRDVATGKTLEAGAFELGGVPEGWTRLVVTAGLDARLQTAHGRELARMTVNETGSVGRLSYGEEIAEAVPWFSIARSENEVRATEWSWRSLSPGWSDKTWRTAVDDSQINVTCGWPVPSTAGRTGGVLALADARSGWALAVELGFIRD